MGVASGGLKTTFESSEKQLNPRR